MRQILTDDHSSTGWLDRGSPHTIHHRCFLRCLQHPRIRLSGIRIRRCAGLRAPATGTRRGARRKYSGDVQGGTDRLLARGHDHRRRRNRRDQSDAKARRNWLTSALQLPPSDMYRGWPSPPTSASNHDSIDAVHESSPSRFQSHTAVTPRKPPTTCAPAPSAARTLARRECSPGTARTATATGN